jgi:hypothetical protein
MGERLSDSEPNANEPNSSEPNSSEKNDVKEVGGFEKLEVETPKEQEKAAAEQEKTVEKPLDSTEKIEEKIEAAKPAKAEDVKKDFAPVHQDDPLAPPNEGLKKHTLNTNLHKIQHHLKGPSKSFSKFIHNDAINTLSEVTGKTLVRPSGILTGGAFTLAGSLYYLYLSKSLTGFRYSFTTALLLFAAGFTIGIVTELLYKVVFKPAKHAKK